MLPQSDLAPSETKIFVRGDFCPVGLVVVSDYGLAQEIVALIGPVAHEGGLVGHLVRGALERVHAGAGQRQRDVAYAELYEPLAGVCLAVSGGTARYLREEIATGELQIVLVEFKHCTPSVNSFKQLFIPGARP